VRRTIALALLWLTACSERVPTAPLTPELEAAVASVRARGGAPAVRGLALGLHEEAPRRPYRAQLREIRAVGATHVSLVVHWYQTDVSSYDLGPRAPDTVSDALLARVIRLAHEERLQVFLFPILQLRTRRPGEWRGALRPSDWRRWFDAYERFVLHYARIAAEHRVALFAVGSELVSSEGRRDDWAALLSRVRSLYRGQVIYSANWDHYRPVAFWDLVDALGVNGYFEVARRHGSSLTAMRAEWLAIRERLVAFAIRMGKPLVFTEIGYPSVEGGATFPWHYTRVAPLDLGEQARAYQAFVESWAGVSALAGVFVWNWVGAGGEKDSGYTPRGKPAGEILRAWFGRR
jgi:hypothetical protein